MFVRCPVEFDGAGDYEVEGLKVFAYLHGACVCEPDSEILCVANVENFHEPVGHPADVGLENRVGASSGIPRARKVARGKLEVGRLEFARERLEDEKATQIVKQIALPKSGQNFVTSCGVGSMLGLRRKCRGMERE